MGSLQELSRHWSNLSSKGGHLPTTCEAYKTACRFNISHADVYVTAGPEEHINSSH